MSDPNSSLHSDSRRLALHEWLCAQGLSDAPIEPASEDASFRRYWRVRRSDGASEIVMDAPPEREPTDTWLQVQRWLSDIGIPVPAVLASDRSLGFVRMSDAGSQHLLALLQRDPTQAHDRYAEALAFLLVMQKQARPEWLPSYDDVKLRAELQLFPDWYVVRHLGATLTPQESQGLAKVFDLLTQTALAQPQAFVHRDYHSRNLMYDAARGWCVLDFQDAVWGPITYDAVSLLRDAYLDWPEEFTLDLLIRYWQQARRFDVPLPAAFEDFYRAYEWMGLQRHLKVLGIFARLAYRDGKTAFLDDLSRVRAYVWKVAMRYEAFRPLRQILARLHPEEVKSALTF